MPVGAAIGASAVVGAGASIYAGNKAAKAQTGAANKASSAEMQMFRETQNANKAAYKQGAADIGGNFKAAENYIGQYDDYGVKANNRLSALSGINGSAAMQRQLEQDPGYQFRMSQGVNALDRSAASRGMLQSGAQQKALTQYGQGLASDELNNAFTRLSSMRDSGQTAANNLSQLRMGRGTALANLAVGQASQNQGLAQNTSNALSGLTMQGGAARAGAYENMGSAINGGIQNGLMAYGMYQQNQPGMYRNNYGTIGGRPYNGPR